MAEWQIERLDPSHEGAEFSCGKAPLDDFLRSRVTQYQKRNLGQTFVAVGPGEKKVCGYYTLASSQISFQSVPKFSGEEAAEAPGPGRPAWPPGCGSSPSGERFGLVPADGRADPMPGPIQAARGCTRSKWKQSIRKPKHFTCTTASSRSRTMTCTFSFR